ncbi:formylmethanofuran dehydrogenase subunit E [Thermincola ferriacetica]|uniref:Formylmethanofuran dehydrogenase subunit E n=1 Tax=Thermincola ferriacetica TaxID=281456 RepID=A0A0L6W0S2_9FIRM|nr:formylmethanofuran dehydrogenase subunit E family protein [Thermincola ferriacetica]KNZ68978.1 formylmethanofuran dehydrogenase subunit E [Thermincola ferriacetica]
MDWKLLPPDLQELAEHHTHLCPGVLIGYKACKYAVDIIGLSENMLVIADRESCGNDAVRFLLKCDSEAGSFICRNGNGFSWSFYNKDEEEGVTLTLNANVMKQVSGDREQAMLWLLNVPADVLFTVQPFIPEENGSTGE